MTCNIIIIITDDRKWLRVWKVILYDSLQLGMEGMLTLDFETESIFQIAVHVLIGRMSCQCFLPVLGCCSNAFTEDLWICNLINP